MTSPDLSDAGFGSCRPNGGDQVSIDAVAEQCFDGGCVRAGRAVGWRCCGAGREGETEEVEQSDDEVGVSGGVGGVLSASG